MKLSLFCYKLDKNKLCLNNKKIKSTTLVFFSFLCHKIVTFWLLLRLIVWNDLGQNRKLFFSLLQRNSVEVPPFVGNVPKTSLLHNAS